MTVKTSARIKVKVKVKLFRLIKHDVMKTYPLLN